MVTFDKEYAEYWAKRVNESSDGSKVSDSKIQEFFIRRLGIAPGDSILDLGCGHGRLFPVLASFTPHVAGIDINVEAIEKARAHPFELLAAGTAEKTGLPDLAFDHIISWATYDVVEQSGALAEENRILRLNGLLLITGKNKDYPENDVQGFIAERNAKLKDFPNHFTDVYALIKTSASFGFEVVEAYGFEKRGDFGELRYFDLLNERQRPFYEFILILKKMGRPATMLPVICHEYSDRAIARAKAQGFDTPLSFFQWHKAQDHE